MAQNATTYGFQAGNIDAIRTERVVCVLKRGNRRRKAFQVFWARWKPLRHISLLSEPRRDSLLLQDSGNRNGRGNDQY
jgi:hypothetical protein